MENNNIESKIIATLSEITMHTQDAIKMHMHLENDLGIDSLSMANLIAKFEDIVSLHPEMNQLVLSLLNTQTVSEFCNILKDTQLKYSA